MHRFIEKSSRPGVALLAVVALSVLLVACVQIRALTYPQSFVYLDREALKGSMQSMAHHIARLHALLDNTEQADIDQTAVLMELDALDGIVASFGAGGSLGSDSLPATNHLLLDEHLEDFEESLLRARLQVEAEPPNYYLTGQLTGACMGCHRWR